MAQRLTCPVCKGLKGLWKVPNLHEHFPAWASLPPEVSAVWCRTCKGSGFVLVDRFTGAMTACRPAHNTI